MDDLTAKLSELLSSPGSLDKIKSLAGMLGGAVQDQPSPEQPEQEPNSSPFGMDADALQMISKVAPLLSGFKQEDDSTRFLRALRPLLGDERQKKLDEAVKILQMMRMLPLLKGSGIL
jgi:hypothetical protein